VQSEAEQGEVGQNGADAEDEPDPPPSCGPRCGRPLVTWYVVHSYAGYENKVKANLENRISSLDMEEYIFQIEVPTEEVTEIKNGSASKVQRKVFPDISWCGWSSTTSPGAQCVTPRCHRAFVRRPLPPSPLSLDEVVRILRRRSPRREGGREPAAGPRRPASPSSTTRSASRSR